MVRFENECGGCTSVGLPCLGSSCRNLNVPRFYCDKCGWEETLYDWNGQELCVDCIEAELQKSVAKKNAVCEKCGKTDVLYDYDGEYLCLSCILERLNKKEL